jgi:predicted dehydrogenase
VTLRFGLVGTGYWARVTHAPAIASTPGAELVAVWGRDLDRARDLAEAFNATAHDDLGAFLAGVDAVGFSVPPDVQAPIATRAAAAGKHLLLEKPVALADNDADRLVQAVDASNVASVVFFTSRFQPEVRAWLADVTEQSGWMGGSATWLGAALGTSSPFNTPWRQVKGGLWDVGPHTVGMLWAALGPVTAVTADHGLADITHLILHHASGVTSTVTVSLSAPKGATRFELSLWGEPGTVTLPPAAGDAVSALRTALAELIANAEAGRTDHPCDVRFGRDITRVLAAAQAELDGRP